MAAIETGRGERRAPRLVVPNVVGLSRENAQALLRNEGFTRTRLHFTESYEPEDQVVEQVPLKGQLAPSDTEVVLHVAKPSLIRFLPSAFQSTGTGADPDFLRRLLWVFHHFLDDLNRKVDRIHLQFSPYSADDEFLPWLAQWVSVTLDADWPVAKKRRMLRSAAEIYKSRGTSSAIRRLLHIFTDVEPEIVENDWPYRGFWIGVHSTIGVDTVVLPPVNLAHCFVVRFPKTYEELGEANVGRIHQIIRGEKPAHAIYYLQFADGSPVVVEDAPSDDGARPSAPQPAADVVAVEHEEGAGDSEEIEGAETVEDVEEPKAAKGTKGKKTKKGKKTS